MTTTFPLDDFREHLMSITRPGLSERMLELMPCQGELKRMIRSGDYAREMRRLSGIIDSMPPSERRNPKLVHSNRRQRIAQGSGVTIREVSNLFHQFQSIALLLENMADLESETMEKMRKLRRGELLDVESPYEDEPWDDDDILGNYDRP